MSPIQIRTHQFRAEEWLGRYRGKKPLFACVLGFTETCLIPGISAAGKTPDDRRYTALADAEFLANGACASAQYPLPPLIAGASPVYISRAIVSDLDLPLYIFNAGLPIAPPIPHIDLGGQPAACITTSAALPIEIVDRLYRQGLIWGEKLARLAEDAYIVIGECVVGGTTTALSLLTGLGIDARDRVNSSHPICNHQQKWEIVERGLAGLNLPLPPLALVAAIGDPMQIVAAGMAIAASQHCGVLLAGGTQMLAVAALIRALASHFNLDVNTAQLAVGTTNWVANDRTGDTVALARSIPEIPLLSTALSFATSRYPQLQVYEQGFVKEGVGAGGLAIAASLYRNWGPVELLDSIERLVGITY